VAQPAHDSVKWPPTDLTRLPPKGARTIESRTQVDRVLGDLIRAEIVRCKLQIRVHSYSAAATVFSQGVRADAIYFVEEGVVKVTRVEADGSFLVVGLRKPGHILGLPSALLRQGYTTGAHALTRCVMHVVAGSDFIAAVQESRDLAWQVLQFQSRKVCERLEKIAWFGALSARDRLIRFLSELASAQVPNGWVGEVKIPTTLKFWEIAQAIGVTAPYLTRLFNELEQDGLLRRSKGRVILTLAADDRSTLEGETRCIGGYVQATPQTQPAT
jgi:CRP-like cAMP-binding protein